MPRVKNTDDFFYQMKHCKEQDQQVDTFNSNDYMINFEQGNPIHLPKLNDNDLEKITYDTIEFIDCNGNIKKERMKIYLYKNFKMCIERDPTDNTQAIFKCRSLL